jgi:hypothetical protein
MAELTRRSALLVGSGAVGALGVAAAVATRSPSGLLAGATTGTAPTTTDAVTAATPATIEVLRRSDFAPGVGLVFTARASRAFAVRLVEIVDVVGATDPEHSFNLLFETVTASHPAEGIHRLSSDATPHRSLMLSPVDRHVPGGVRRFQALVNTAA